MKFKTLAAHFAIVVIYILYETFASLYFGSAAGFWDFACFYVLNICFFYTNAYLTVETALSQKKPFRKLIGLVIVELVVYCLLFMITGQFTGYIYGKTFVIKWDQPTFVRSIVRGLYFLGFSMTYSFARYYVRQASENAKLAIRISHSDKEKARFQTAFLKAQINSHLINNSMAFAIRKLEGEFPQVKRALILISEIIRYAIDAVGPDGMVSLKTEIEQVRRIIELYKLKSDVPLFVNLNVSGTSRLHIYRIVPSVIATVAENIFQHGSLTDPYHPAAMEVRIENGKLGLIAWNLKKNNLIAGSQIGLKNTSERLNLFYGQDFTFDVIDEEKQFTIKMNLPLCV